VRRTNSAKRGTWATDGVDTDLQRISIHGGAHSADTTDRFTRKGCAMSWARNLPLSRKFTYAFSVVCALSLIMSVYTFTTFRSIVQESQDVSEDAIPSIAALADARGAMNVLRREDLDLILCQNQGCITESMAKRQQAVDNYASSIRKYEPLISYPGEREMYQKLVSAWAQYKDISDRGVAMLEAGKTGDALDTLGAGTAKSAFSELLAATNQLVTLNLNGGAASAPSSFSTARRTRVSRIGLWTPALRAWAAAVGAYQS